MDDQPGARRMGPASALTIKAVWAAQDAGPELAVLPATRVAEKLYAILGYETVTPFQLLTSEETII